MKGIILAGGSGSRMYPSTYTICKQLLPVYDKPLIYYPLSTLMLAGIRDVLIITTSKDVDRFHDLLGDGSSIGIKISYAIQDKPKGIADAFIIGEEFIDGQQVCLILGDNIFHGQGLPILMKKAFYRKEGATIFGYYVGDPKRYGVVSFDTDGKAQTLEEKPQSPKSNYAVVGLYIYDNQVVNIAKNLQPSKRGELEITDLNIEYLKKNQLEVELLGRGYAWLDTGTHESMLDASLYIRTIEKRQGLKIAAIEEIAYNMGYIDKEQLKELAESLKTSTYGSYLKSLLQ